MKNTIAIKNMADYRQPTPIGDVFKYVAPMGYDFYKDSINLGGIIYGNKILNNDYYLKKWNKYGEDNE